MSATIISRPPKANTQTLFNLLDLSLGTPEAGAVNFNILKILLRELLRLSRLGNELADLSDPDEGLHVEAQLLCSQPGTAVPDDDQSQKATADNISSAEPELQQGVDDRLPGQQTAGKENSGDPGGSGPSTNSQGQQPDRQNVGTSDAQTSAEQPGNQQDSKSTATQSAGHKSTAVQSTGPRSSSNAQQTSPTSTATQQQGTDDISSKKVPNPDSQDRGSGSDQEPKVGPGPDSKLLFENQKFVSNSGREIPLGPDGQPIFDPDDLEGPNGRPLQGSDGRRTDASPQGVDKGPDGQILLGPDGKPVDAANILYGPDGTPILDKNGHPIPLNKNNETLVLGPDGLPVLGPDGLPLYSKPGDILTNPDGSPVLDKNGDPIPMLKNGQKLVLGPDGLPVLGPDGLPMYSNQTSTLKRPDGTPVLDQNGDPIPLNTSQGTLVLGPDGLPVLGPDGLPLYSKQQPGVNTFDGQSRTKTPSVDENGAPILDKEGKPIYVSTESGVNTDGGALRSTKSSDCCCDLYCIQRHMIIAVQDRLDWLYNTLISEITRNQFSSPFGSIGPRCPTRLGACSGQKSCGLRTGVPRIHIPGLTDTCPVCCGIGRTQKGEKCPACQGTGYKSDPKCLCDLQLKTSLNPSPCRNPEPQTSGFKSSGCERHPACCKIGTSACPSAVPTQNACSSFKDRRLNKPGEADPQDGEMYDILRKEWRSLWLLPKDLETLRTRLRNDQKFPAVFDDADILERVHTLWEAVISLKNNDEALAVRIIKLDASLRCVPSARVSQQLERIPEEVLEALACANSPILGSGRNQQNLNAPGESAFDKYEKISGPRRTMLARDISRHKLDEMFQTLHKIENTMVTKKILCEAIADKADQNTVASKVSYEDFTNSIEELSNRMQSLLIESYQKNDVWQATLNNLSQDMLLKLDKGEMNSIRAYFKSNLKALEKRMDCLWEELNEPDPAGTRKKLLKDYNCISCDRHTNISGVTNMPMLPRLKATDARCSSLMASQRTFEMHRLRQKQNGRTDGADFKEYLQQNAKGRSGCNPYEAGDMNRIINRYVGGSHTCIAAADRVQAFRKKSYKSEYYCDNNQAAVAESDPSNYAPHVTAANLVSKASEKRLNQQMSADRPEDQEPMKNLRAEYYSRQLVNSNE